MKADQPEGSRRIQKVSLAFLLPMFWILAGSSNIGLLYGQVMGELNGGSLGFAENSSRRESTNAEDKGQNMPGLCQ